MWRGSITGKTYFGLVPEEAIWYDDEDIAFDEPVINLIFGLMQH